VSARQVRRIGVTVAYGTVLVLHMLMPARCLLLCRTLTADADLQVLSLSGT
jgi:hypothetical protein